MFLSSTDYTPTIKYISFDYNEMYQSMEHFTVYLCKRKYMENLNVILIFFALWINKSIYLF